MEVGLGPGDLVFDGNPAPSQKKGTAPTEYLANVYGQTAGWIKMPLGMEVSLGPGNVVLDGIALPLKQAQPPVFGPCLLWPNGWMDDATFGTEVDLCSGHIVLHGDAAAPAKGAQQPNPLFGPCLLWPLSPISATAELLFNQVTTIS